MTTLRQRLEIMIQLVKQMQSEQGCRLSNAELSTLLNFPEEEVAEAINELTAAGVIQRRKVTGGRQLNLLQKRKESRQRKEKNNNIKTKVDSSTTDSLSSKQYTTYTVSCPSESAVLCPGQAKPGPGVQLRRRTSREKQRYDLLVKQQQGSLQFEVPATIERLVDFWNDLGLKTCWKRRTKTYKDTVLYLKRLRMGTLYRGLGEERRFSDEEIKKVFRRFSISVQNPDYEPSNGSFLQQFLSKMTLRDFLLNEHAKVKSYFLHYHKTPLQRARYTTDKYPAVSAVFRSFYVEKVLGGLRNKNGMREADEFHFRKAAERAVEFLREHLPRMNTAVLQLRKKEDFARVVCDAVGWDIKEEWSKLTPGWLSSDTTFQQRLPRYLNKEGILTEEQGWLL